MNCEFCGGTTVKKVVRKHHWLQGRLYVVENVEAEVCPQCGERYFHAVVLDKIDCFLTSEHAVKERLDVELVSL
ncbi:MAG: YgiT-type zinc finger protein [Candidatus Coatesbacteria bacterium]|nr:YgiT-type zinc finger protein [Candidatus Coatesbacteria bacterium]